MSQPAVAESGDWIEEPSADGSPPRGGLVLEVLGADGHRHYRVRWDEEHASIHFPSPCMRVRRRGAAGQASGAGTRTS